MATRRFYVAMCRCNGPKSSYLTHHVVFFVFSWCTSCPTKPTPDPSTLYSREWQQLVQSGKVPRSSLGLGPGEITGQSVGVNTEPPTNYRVAEDHEESHGAPSVMEAKHVEAQNRKKKTKNPRLEAAAAAAAHAAAAAVEAARAAVIAATEADERQKFFEALNEEEMSNSQENSCDMLCGLNGKAALGGASAATCLLAATKTIAQTVAELEKQSKGAGGGKQADPLEATSNVEELARRPAKESVAGFEGKVAAAKATLWRVVQVDGEGFEAKHDQKIVGGASTTSTATPRVEEGKKGEAQQRCVVSFSHVHKYCKFCQVQLQTNLSIICAYCSTSRIGSRTRKLKSLCLHFMGADDITLVSPECIGTRLPLCSPQNASTKGRYSRGSVSQMRVYQARAPEGVQTARGEIEARSRLSAGGRRRYAHFCLGVYLVHPSAQESWIRCRRGTEGFQPFLITPAAAIIAAHGSEEEYFENRQVPRPIGRLVPGRIRLRSTCPLVFSTAVAATATFPAAAAASYNLAHVAFGESVLSRAGLFAKTKPKKHKTNKLSSSFELLHQIGRFL